MGHLDPEAMLGSMTERQIVGWHAYRLLEPWGFAIDEDRYVQMGIIASRGVLGDGQLRHHPPLSVRPRMSLNQVKAVLGRGG